MINPVSKVRNWITSDGPGFTDYPEADISAHRSIAKTTRWIGYVGAAAMFVAHSIGPYNQPVQLGIAILIVVGITQWVSAEFRIEALEWEVELLREERDDA